MIRPGTNTEFTSFLLYACLATIPLVFMMAIVGGKDLSDLIKQGNEITGAAGPGIFSILLWVGLVVLVIIMPLGMFLGIWWFSELKLNIYFILYFIPLLSQLVFSTRKVCVSSAITQAVLIIVTLLLSAVIVALLTKHTSQADIYEKHFQVIWPDYEGAASMFFWICSFALLSQLTGFLQAIFKLLGNR